MEKIKPVLKVLHVHTLPVISGSGINTLDTMRGLLARGYEVEFACAPGGGGLIEEVRKLGIQFRPLNNLVRQVSPVKDIAALFELAALIREHKYSIVHTHNSKAGFIGRLAAKMAGTPIVIHTVHGFAFHDYEKPPLRFLYALLERFAANFSDKLIVVSTPLKDWGLKLKVGQVGQYRVIPDGIDIKRFSVKVNTQEKRKELGLKEDELVVGLAAKLWDGKGHEVLIQAIPEITAVFPNARFIFVGEGYLRAHLENLIAQKGLKKYVIFTGYRKDIPELTSIFDVAVLPSFYEGLGRSLLEAMTLGKPVVASRVGCILEVVKDNENGILINPGDSGELASAVIRLLKDEGLRQKMGEEGVLTITERFSVEKMVEQIDLLYRSFLP